MVVAKHIGRLGNNMLQIAAALGYARKYGYQWAADYGSGVGEPYSSIHRVFPNLPKSELNGTRYHEHPNAFCKLHDQHFNDCHFNYHPIPDLGPNVALTGFFQSWKYFENSADEIREVFKLQHHPEMEQYVSIHVRRGDYVQHAQSFPPVSDLYVNEAMAKFPGAKFMFFSDDIGWGRASWGNRIEYSEGRSEYDDLCRMASCSHHIIANSTFSWWAGILGHNPDRIVVTPSHKKPHWFGALAGVKQDCVDLIPSGWIEIEWNR